MKYLLPLLLLISTQLYAAEQPDDNKWVSQWFEVNGIKQQLTIIKSKHAILERHYNDGRKRRSRTNAVSYARKILFVKFKQNKHTYGFSISEWNTSDRSKLPSTLIMYNEHDKKYKKVPLTLERSNSNN